LTDFKKEKQSNTEIREKYQYFEDFMETVSIFLLYPSKRRSGNAKNFDSQITLHALSFAIIKKGVKNFCITPYYETAQFNHGLSLKCILYGLKPKTPRITECTTDFDTPTSRETLGTLLTGAFAKTSAISSTFSAVLVVVVLNVHDHLLNQFQQTY
jgi:hypothetical protein